MSELSYGSGLNTGPAFPRLRQRLDTCAGPGALFLVFLFAGWSALQWFETVRHIVRCYSPVPLYDYWRTAALLHSYQALDIRVLWRQHNDHRIIFPEVLFAADLLFLHGRQLIPICASFLSYLGNWAVLFWAFWSIETLSRPSRAIAALLAGVIMAWEGSADIIADAFLLQWTLTQIGALLALAFLVRLRETARTRYLTGTTVCAVISTYSSSNGLVLWPVLIGSAIVLLLPPRRLIVLGSSAVLSIGLYFVGYRFAGNLSVLNLISHPLYFLEFVGSYMSMPFGAMKSPYFGVMLGAGALLIVIALAISAYRSRMLASRPGIVLFGGYAFFLLTAVLTAAGRMDASDPLFGAAKAARYLSGPLVAWGIFILLCAWVGSRWRKELGYLIVGVCAVLVVIAFLKLRAWVLGQDAEFANAQLTALAMEQGLYDPPLMMNVFPDPVSAELWSKDLRDANLSVFYKAHRKWLGRPASDFAVNTHANVPGAITYMFPVRDGVEVAGWFDSSKQTRRNPQWVLLANEAGRIAGFGRKLPAGFPNSLDDPRTPPSLAWAGFINLRCSVRTLSAFVIEKRGLVALEGAAVMPEERVVDGASAGPPLPGIAWQMDSSWNANGLPNVRFGLAPPGQIYSSWSGSDAHTGRLVSSIFPAPNDGCLILPVVQGPRADGLSAEVLDARANQRFAHAWFNNGMSAWRFWRISVPRGAKQLRIIAEDRGKDWGEWLAMGQPSKCK